MRLPLIRGLDLQALVAPENPPSIPADGLREELLEIWKIDPRQIFTYLLKVEPRHAAEEFTHRFDDVAPRSKSEVIIANLLHALGITYAYEQPFTGQDGSVRYPDFTIEDAETGRRVFLEHLGLMSEPAYRRRWSAKLDWYRSQGVLPEDEGEGEVGILVTTTEGDGIDSVDIEQKLRSLLGL